VLNCNYYLVEITNTISEFENCKICPRECGVNRLSDERGYCGAGSGFHISSICIHKGEEPALSGANGICNVFFSHCNLSCIYCQNNQISCRGKALEEILDIKEVVERIEDCLQQGVYAVGFVSPSHMVPQVKMIISALREKGLTLTFIWNSNGYDKTETLRSLESYIDVYLPDFKYLDHEDAKQFSDAENYPEIALAAIKEMYYQKGSKLFLNKDGLAERGLIIRHLVLPDKADASIKLLKTIAEEISTKVTISLMAQYYPTEKVMSHNILNRQITKEEYLKVTNAMYDLGFTNGWIQEHESAVHYRPDFEKEHPFEK
jgi:putative pyruvate formate lyase activating enzyme